MVTTEPFASERIREDFPALKTLVRDRRLVYLDSAATTLKPQVVIDSVADYYGRLGANVHRGVHYLSEEATRLYEASRLKVKTFLNASATSEIIFTSGTTAGINLVAQSFGQRFGASDEIVISHMEHHSNIVPWQMLCQRTGAALKVAPINDKGELIFEAFERLLSDKTRLVAIAGVSNALGTVNPIREIIASAHARGIPVLIDGAQMAPHVVLDVQALDCDFFVFSGHKLYGPTGVGVLYGKRHLLEELPPVMGGGDMIRSVSFERTDYAGLPARLEAGTPNIAGVIGLGAALDYLNRVGLANVQAHEADLLDYGTQALESTPGVTLIGTAANKASVLSFTLEGVHPHDIGSILDSEGVAVRAGHHCAQPVMAFFGVPATARASIGLYNTRDDIDCLVHALQKARKLFQ